jgi:phosphoribosylformimino-5-aminoimidazole carboxamide ribotide isomerase
LDCAREKLVIILPAIDVRGGKCVRLQQGDYGRETVFDDDPAAMAQCFVFEGARYLHIVDLDGAKEGRPINGDCIQRIVQASGVPCQLGGGLRTEADIALALSWEIERVVIGTRALKAPGWFEEMCLRFPDKIVLGIDARDGKVATDGWLESSEIGAIELAQRFEQLPLVALVYTDIARDGMLQGANVAAMAQMAAAVRIPVIASGGITTAQDVQQLANNGLAGCIVGRALYEGKLNLKNLISLVCDS